MGNIRIDNLQFSYSKDHEVFQNVTYTLPKDKTLSVIGTCGSGKTTFLKILNGELEYHGEIVINGLDVVSDNKEALKNVFSVVYQDSAFITDLVKDELRFPLENVNLSPTEIKKRIDEIDLYFNIHSLYNKKIDYLSRSQKVLIKILSYAISYPSYLALDDLLSELDHRTKILLLNYLNSKHILLINVTSNMEDTLYTDCILCLYDGINAIDGKTLDVLSNEKVLKRLGFELPFYIDLSIQLQLYGLIHKTYLNKEAMVKNLWK